MSQKSAAMLDFFLAQHNSCCSPSHVDGDESDSLLLSLASTKAVQLEDQTSVSPSQLLGFGAVEATTPTLKITASSHVLTCHQLEDTELAKATSEATTRTTWRRCRFRQGYVYTRRLRCGSGRPRRDYGAVADIVPMDIGRQRDTIPTSPKDGSQTAREVALANFIQSVTKPVQQPLLPPQQHGPVKPRREKKRLGKPPRRSARLAAVAWPHGDTQSKARQVLMKRLGITQEGGTREMALLRNVNLFKGPMSELVMKSLVDLSGLDGPTILE